MSHKGIMCYGVSDKKKKVVPPSLHIKANFTHIGEKKKSIINILNGITNILIKIVSDLKFGDGKKRNCDIDY